MPTIVRRFYDGPAMFNEVSPEVAEWSCEMVLDDNGKVVDGTTQLSQRKRHPEVFGSLVAHGEEVGFWRASSLSEMEKFHAHWSKERV